MMLNFNWERSKEENSWLKKNWNDAKKELVSFFECIFSKLFSSIPSAEAVEQMARVESSCEEDNRARKIAEVRSQEAEDRIDSMENQLQEAQELAQTANHKYEEVERRLRMVQNELERALEKADDYET